MLTLGAFLFGAILGSFLNVVVIRHGARSLGGRSACLSCARAIPWYDNMPVLSWLLLRGRCRSCGSSISVHYLVVEIVTAVLFATLASALVPTLAPIALYDAVLLGMYGALVALLIAIALYDARHTIIPDVWVWPFAFLALAIALLTSYAEPWMTIVSGPAAALPLFALWFVSRGRWMGLGDAKLALGIGWFLGPLYGVASIFFGFVIGAVVSVCILLPLPYVLRALAKTGIVRWRGARASFTMKSEVAFGPYLVAAFFYTWISLLYNLPLPLPV